MRFPLLSTWVHIALHHTMNFLEANNEEVENCSRVCVESVTTTTHSQFKG